MWKLRPRDSSKSWSNHSVCVAGHEEEDRREDHMRRLGRGWRKSLWEERKNQKIKRQSLWLEYK